MTTRTASPRLKDAPRDGTTKEQTPEQTAAKLFEALSPMIEALVKRTVAEDIGQRTEKAKEDLEVTLNEMFLEAEFKGVTVDIALHGPNHCAFTNTVEGWEERLGFFRGTIALYEKRIEIVELAIEQAWEAFKEQNSEA